MSGFQRALSHLCPGAKQRIFNMKFGVMGKKEGENTKTGLKGPCRQKQARQGYCER